MTHVTENIKTGEAWDKAKAAFILELIVLGPTDSTAALRLGRSMVLSRPSTAGADANDDRFEMLWHHVGLATAYIHPDQRVLQEYLGALGVRFDPMNERLQSRIPLIRAMAAAIECCWKKRPYELVRSATRPSKPKFTLSEALTLFVAAAGFANLKAEAAVRAGKLLTEEQRHDEALVWLKGVPPHTDEVLTHVQYLTLGRVLDRLGRPAEAAIAYETAKQSRVADQRATVGLAAALLRSGQVERAVSVAELATDVGGTSIEFTPLGFSHGDWRFVPEWLAEIRTLRR